MSSFYRTKKIVLNKISAIIESAKGEKLEIDVNALRLQLMLNFEVGELSINKMVSSLGKYHGFKVVDDTISWD